MDKTMDRAIGAYLGLAIGDAMGAPLEFSKRDSLPPVTGFRDGGPFGLKAGEWTDDTSCALALANTLSLGQGAFDGNRFMEELSQWYRNGRYSHNGRCFDIGNQTRKAIEADERGRPLPPDENAQGNGALMRLAPVALVARSEIEATVMAAEQAKATHPSATCVADAMALGHTLWNAIDGCEMHFLGMEGYPRERVVSSGHSSCALYAAKWAVANTKSFEEAVLLAVNLGDDSDTVGAITGQIAGAIYGFTGIPRAWRDEVAWSAKIVGQAGQLFALRGR